MARKRYSDEDVLRLLREIELNLSSGHDVAGACRAAGVSEPILACDATVAASLKSGILPGLCSA